MFVSLCVLLFLLVFEGRMWDLIVLIPDHCLSIYYVKQIARNPLNFNLLITSPEFSIDRKKCLPDLSRAFSKYLMTFFTAVRHSVNILES